MSQFIRSEEGFYSLTNSGYTALVILLILVMSVCAFIADKKQSAKKINAKQLAFAGIALALAFVTSYIKYELPMGGSVTLFSMFFICFTAYLYGVKVGLITAFAYSILQFMQSGATYFLTPFQVCCDYFFAFTALGLAGLWYGKKHGLTVGYVVACLLRGLFHTIGGYIYWMDYMPEWFPSALTKVYSIIYNYSYILVEMVITLVIINLPPVKKALEKVKAMC